jgi:hypothetical protein
MIAVTFAHPSESRDFLRLPADLRENVAVLHTGIGGAACRRRLGLALDAGGFAFVISSGFAGALNDSLGVGDLFLAENFSDPTLLAQAEQLLTAASGRLASVDRVIEGGPAREQLARAERAAAVDMETAAIAEACRARGLRLLSLRAISDSNAAPFPLPPAILFDLEKQRPNFSALVAHLLRHPAAVVSLLQFQRRIADVRANLTAALIILLRSLDPGG